MIRTDDLLASLSTQINPPPFVPASSFSGRIRLASPCLLPSSIRERKEIAVVGWSEWIQLQQQFLCLLPVRYKNLSPMKIIAISLSCSVCKPFPYFIHQVTYLCGGCGTQNGIKPQDTIRCRTCGYRILYKIRTKRRKLQWRICRLFTFKLRFY